MVDDPLRCKLSALGVRDHLDRNSDTPSSLVFHTLRRKGQEVLTFDCRQIQPLQILVTFDVAALIICAQRKVPLLQRVSNQTRLPAPTLDFMSLASEFSSFFRHTRSRTEPG